MTYFKDKVVVITGAASGMGRSYAYEFAGQGAKLALMDYDAQGLQETVQQLAANGNNAVYSEVFDVSNREAMFTFAANVKKAFGTADVIINNAGIEGGIQPVWALDKSHYERVMGVNFYGVVNGTQAFLPMLLEKRSGHIVNVSSIFGLIGTPSHSDYCASKFAVRGFTEALMTELNNSPVQVHLVHPGGIATNIARSAGAQAFNKHYLTTSADDIAVYVRKSLEQGRVKIVYGNDSQKTWLGSNFVPLKLLNKVVWHDLKKVIDLSAYVRAGVLKR